MLYSVAMNITCFAYLKVMTTLGIWEDNDMTIATAVTRRYGTSNIQLLSQYPLSAIESPVTQVQFSKIGFCYV